MPHTAQPDTGQQRSRRKAVPIIIGALLLVAALVLAFLFWPKAGLFTSPEARAASATDCVVEHLTTQGWVQGTDFTTDLTVQDGDEIFSSGASAFSANPIFSTAELSEFLKSGDARAELATQVVQSAVGDKDVQWVGIKYLVPIQIEGNLGTDGATVVDFGTRNSGAGEIIFYPVDMANCQVIEGIIIRAGCGNPGKGVVPPCRENCEPPECPAGNEIPKCAPKPGDPDEWVGGDGIDVDAGEYTGEDPPEVTTEETNNGVTDNANQDPGSETGGNAGGDANTGDRDPAPPPEDGVNGSDDEDGSSDEEISNPFG
jgi:hypothetical protein